MGFEIVSREGKKEAKADVSFVGKEVAQSAKKYHESFPMYQETPLRALNALAGELGVKEIYIKDESYRFGLNAFKVLGGSFAIGSYIAKQLGIKKEELTYEQLVSRETRRKLGKMTFISATDGNHGRGVAWTAKQLMQDCVIYMPKGSSMERLNYIKAEGAKVKITDFNYDDAVRLASKHAAKNNWVLVQDTSWPGYEEIPIAIMQGYTTMVLEVYEQLKGVKPTHIFVQAGVGSFATAVAGFFADVYGEEKPVITIVEPNEAACVFKTMKINDGKIHPVTGYMHTIMAGLACGETVTVGVDVLRDYVEHFISCPDYAAADGMRVLSSPLKDDLRIIAGESGAAGFGCMYEIMTDKGLEDLKIALGINAESVILCFNSEGDTDKASYRRIVWEGEESRIRE